MGERFHRQLCMKFFVWTYVDACKIIKMYAQYLYKGCNNSNESLHAYTCAWMVLFLFRFHFWEILRMISEGRRLIFSLLADNNVVVCIPTRICISICTYIYIYIYVCVCVCVCVCMYVCMYVCIRICIYVYAYLYAYVYVYMYMYRKKNTLSHTLYPFGAIISMHTVK